MKTLAFWSLLLGLAQVANGHASISDPCPRYSNAGVKCPALPKGVSSFDSDINAPIGTHGSIKQPLCKFKSPWPTPAATWTAGQSVTIKFNPTSISHSGGHCEFSISYDGGKTFAVIHRELQYCFVGKKPSGTTNVVSVNSYTFDLPKNLPSSKTAIFAWSWINASGAREFYMNCADVAISGSSSTSYTGTAMVIANYGDYPLIDEFKGDYTTGMDLYNNAKTITVSSGGSGTEGGNVNNEEDEESSSSSRKPMAPRDVTDPDKCDPDSASADDPGNDPNDNLDTNTDDPNTEETGDVKCEPDTTDTAGDTNTTDTDEKCDTDEESDTATDTAADSTDLGDQCDTDETDMSSDATTDTYDLGDVCDPDESSEYSSAMPTSTTSTTSVVTSTTSSVFSEYQSSSNGQSSSEDTDLGGLDSDSSSPTPTSSEEPSSTTSCYALPVVNSNEPGLKCSVPTNGPTESSSDDSIATDVDSSYPKFEISTPGAGN